MTIKLPPELEKKRKAQAISSVYRTATRILTGENITVSFVNGDVNAPPAWTDGVAISINGSHIQLDDFNYVERLHGLVFHETAHVLFSPRKHSKIVSWAIKNDYFKAMNCLEDNRIEHLLTAKYPSTSPWLSVMLTRWILQLSDAELVYPLLVGRRYLSKDIRDAARSVYHLQDRVKDVERLVLQYRDLVFPMDYDRAMPIIEEFAALIATPSGNDLPKSVCRDLLVNGSPVGGKDQRGWRDSKNSSFEDDDDFDDDDDQDDESSDTPTCTCVKCGSSFAAYEPLEVM